MKSTPTIPSELLELLDEYKQFYKITVDIVDVYKRTVKLYDNKRNADKEIIQKYLVNFGQWMNDKKRFIKETRTDLFNQFRAIRDSLNPVDISNDTLKVFSKIRRVSSNIDNNIFFLFNTLN